MASNEGEGKAMTPIKVPTEQQHIEGTMANIRAALQNEQPEGQGASLREKGLTNLVRLCMF